MRIPVHSRVGVATLCFSLALGARFVEFMPASFLALSAHLVLSLSWYKSDRVLIRNWEAQNSLSLIAIVLVWLSMGPGLISLACAAVFLVFIGFCVPLKIKGDQIDQAPPIPEG